MGGGGGTQPRAPSATATVNEELGGSERDGDGGGRGGGLAGGHGGVGMRVVARLTNSHGAGKGSSVVLRNARWLIVRNLFTTK